MLITQSGSDNLTIKIAGFSYRHFLNIYSVPCAQVSEAGFSSLGHNT